MNDGKTDPDAALAALRQAMDWLTSGLRQMLEVQATQTIMLQAVLEAATATSEPEQELAQTLEQMLLALNEQTKVLAKIHKVMTEPA
jgi:hypothetical protein